MRAWRRGAALALTGAVLLGCAGADPGSDRDPAPTSPTASPPEAGPTSEEAGATTGEADGTTGEPAPSTGPADGTVGDADTTTGDAEATTAEPGEVSVAFVGDVMLARSVGERLVEDPGAPFAGVIEPFTEADLVVGTLETAVGEAGEPEDKIYTFQAPPEAVDSLQIAGFDLVSLANNHSYDFGVEGLLETMELLEAGGIAHVGAGADADAAREPVVLSAGGVDTAFLAYVDVPDDGANGYRNRDWAASPTDPGVAWAVPEQIESDVAAAGQQADHIIVLLHAGAEGSAQPDASQHAAADAALGAGATAVIGSHPHVLQGHRLEEGQLTAWSLGNFVFDGFQDPETTRSVVLTVQLDRDGLTDTRWTPVQLVDSYPEALDPDGAEGRAVLEHLESLPSQR